MVRTSVMLRKEEVTVPMEMPCQCAMGKSGSIQCFTVLLLAKDKFLIERYLIFFKLLWLN